MIDLLPHQQGLVDAVMAASSGARLLLIAPVGTGKTSAIAAAAARRLGGESAATLLVIAPKSLHGQWIYAFSSEGLSVEPIDGPSLRSIEATTESPEDAWNAIDRGIVSPHFLTRQERWRAVSRRRWALVIVDEVDKFESQSQTGGAIRSFWDSSGIEILVGVSSLPVPAPWFAERATSIVRWSASSLGLTIPSKLDSARTRVLRFSYTAAERHVLDLLPLLEQDSEFAYHILWRRAGSSFYALAQTLRRQAIPDSPQDLISEPTIDNEALSSDEQPPLEERVSPAIIRELLALLEQVDEDSKWNACKRAVDSTTGRVLVLTGHADTADYLAEIAREDGFDVTVLTGRLSPASRQSAAGEGRPAAVIIATDAALEGIRLRQVSEVIHYDISLNPSRLHERLLSVGDREHPVEHVFLIPEEPESDRILSGLLEKAARIDAELGGVGQVLD